MLFMPILKCGDRAKERFLTYNMVMPSIRKLICWWVFPLMILQWFRPMSLVSGAAIPTLYGATEIIGAERFVAFQSVEIPLELRYKIQFQKLAVYPALGLRSTFYTHKEQNVEILLDNGEIVDHSNNDMELEHNRNVNFSAVFKLGIQYQTTDRLSLKLEPFYRYHLAQEEVLTKYDKTNLTGLGLQLVN